MKQVFFPNTHCSPPSEHQLTVQSCASRISINPQAISFVKRTKWPSVMQDSRSMRGFRQVDENLDEYEDYYEDQHGDLGADQYEDEEEEEEEKEQTIPEEKLRYLDLRQKLKEKARSKIRKENGDKDRSGASPLGKFGSFFGPAKPVVADRVIQESKSLLETRHLEAKQSTPQNDGKKVTMPSTSESKNVVTSRPHFNQAKSKAQIIRQTRDFYSSLLSDYVEIPNSGSNPGTQKDRVPKTDARSAQVPVKSSQPSSSSSRRETNGYEQRKPYRGVPQQSRIPQTAPPQRLTSGSRANLVSSDSKRPLDGRKQSQYNKQPRSNKHPGSSNDNGPVRSAVRKVLPPKKPLSTSEKKASIGVLERKTSTHMGNKLPTVAKNSTSNGQRPPPVKSQTSIVSSRLVNKRDIQHSCDRRLLKEENISASRPQTGRPPKQDPIRSNSGKDRYIKEQRPSGQNSVHKSGATNKDPNNKKRRADEAFSDEEFDYRSVIRGMFGRSRHYEDVDDDEDDDMCMEVGFDAIQQEEKRSARIAKKEDDEELIKIMEEERQERLRKQAKLRRR